MPLPHQPPLFTWSREFLKDHVNVTLTGTQSNDRSATATETATPSGTTDTPATR